MKAIVILCDTCDKITDHLVQEMYKLIDSNVKIADDGEIRITCLDNEKIQDIITRQVALSIKLGKPNGVESTINFVNERDKALTAAIDYLEGTCGNPTSKQFLENLFLYISRAITDQLNDTASKRLVNAMSIVTDNINSGNIKILAARKFDINTRKYILKMYSILKEYNK